MSSCELLEKKEIFNASQIAQIAKATLVGDGSLSFCEVCINSREAKAGALFVALKGEKSDGHLYLLDAAKNGATIFLVEESKIEESVVASLLKMKKAIVVAKNSLLALHQIASAHLDKFKNLIRVGLTGSSGKTTTKEILVELLKTKYNLNATRGNLNSEIGLPIMALETTEANDLVLLEMGIDHIGEMESLSSILKPDYALITFIGSAHVGKFGSRDLLAQQKGKIFCNFDDSSHGYVNEKDPLAIKEAKKYRGYFQHYGVAQNAKGRFSMGNFYFEDRALAGWEVTLQRKGEVIAKSVFALIGKHNLENLSGAISLALDLGISEEDIISAIGRIKTLFGRNNVKELQCESGEKITLIEDCYNANRESLNASIDFFDSLQTQFRKVALLGSMKELGIESEEIHREVGKRLCGSSIDSVFLIGEEATWIYESLLENHFAGGAFLFASREELAAEILNYKKANDIWLFKASRSMALEEFEKSLTGENRC